MKPHRFFSHITKFKTLLPAVLAVLFIATNALPALAQNSAAFVSTDDATQGDWQGVYGADGFNVIGDTVNYPSYATVTPAGKTNYTWDSNPADVRALERDGGGRIAATWYSPTTFEVDINITDGQTHQVAFYSVDWEPIGREQTYEVFDGDTTALLDSARLFTGFSGGRWIVYNISGHVKVRITKTVGANAVLSGIFFDAVPVSCAIAYGDYVTDTISPDGDVDACTFNSTAGEQVIVPYREISGTALFRPKVTIFDPDNIELGASSGAGNRGELIVPITKTGVHRIEMSDSNGSGTGTYEYILQSTNSPANAASVAYGDTVTGGIIDPQIDLDIYSFNGGTGDQVIIPFHRTSSSQTFLTTVRVFDPSGNLVATQSGAGGDGELATTLSANGTHTIIFNDDDQDLNGIGTYEFSLYSTNNPTNVTAIAYGDTVTGQDVIPAVDLDTYSFSGSANDKVALVYHKTGGESSFITDVRLYNATGTLIAQSDGAPGGTGIIETTLTANETYFILVGDRNQDKTGSYELHLQRRNGPANTVTLVKDVPVVDENQPAVELNVYSFTASTSDEISIPFSRLSGQTGYTTFLKLFDPNGMLLTSASTNSSAQLDYTIPADGTFYLFVKDNNYDETGMYQIELNGTFGGTTNNPPVLDPIGPKNVAVDSNLTFMVNATDDPGDTLIYTTGTLPLGATFNGTTKTFDWTPVVGQEGPHVVRFNVEDQGGLNDFEDVTISVDPVSSGGNSAVYVTMDNSTQGDWMGAYGGDGYNVIGDSVAYPAYATVTPNGERFWQWDPNPSDPRALERAGGGRIAATWYSPGMMELDINITDGQSHEVALYMLDWDPAGRAQTIEMRDGDTDVLLDTRSTNDFVNGKYFVWTISGHIKVKVIRNSGPNAVIGGIFFGAGTPPTNNPPILNAIGPRTIQAETPLSIILNATDDPGDTLVYTTGTLPLHAMFDGGTRTFDWTPTTDQLGDHVVRFMVEDQGGLSDFEDVTITVEGTILPPTNSAVYVTMDSATQGDWMGMYGGDGYNVIGDSVSYPSYASVTPSGKSNYTWDSNPTDMRALERAGGGRIAATWYSPSMFEVDVAITDGQAHDIALYMVDWEPTGRAQTIEMRDGDTGELLDTRSTADFVNGKYFVWTIQGHIKIKMIRNGGPNTVLSGIFFGPGSVLPNEAPILDPIGSRSIPYDQALSITVNATDDPGDTLLYTTGTLPMDATFNGTTRTFDWTPSIDQLGNHLVRFIVEDQEGLSDFEDVTITVEGTITPPTNSAMYVSMDNATQGDWMGVYGGDGYNVIGDSASYPAYATVTPTAERFWQWDGNPADPRALQRAAGGRIAATWYAPGMMEIDINITDGQSHEVALYMLDWDAAGRTQTIEMRDGDTDELLDTRTTADFVNGKYFVWSISGHITVKVIRNSGPNAVINGIFFGPAGGGDFPPYLDMLVPAAGETAVAPATDVLLHIKDDETGVDLTSVVITVGDPLNVVYDGSVPASYPDTVVSGTLSAYQFVYTPPVPFDYDEVVAVTVTAADLAANGMMDSYSFTIRSPAVDLLELAKIKILVENKPLEALDLLDQLLVAEPTNPAAKFWRALVAPMQQNGLRQVLEDVGFWNEITGVLILNAQTSSATTVSLLPDTTALAALCVDALAYMDESLMELGMLDMTFMDMFTVTVGVMDVVFDLDYAEVKAVESTFHALKTGTHFKLAYDVTGQDLHQILMNETPVIDLLLANPDLFTLTTDAAARLGSSRTAFINGISAYLAGSDYIRNVRDDNDGLNHLVRLYDPYIPEMYNSFAEWQAEKDAALAAEAIVRSLLEDIKTNLEGGAPFVIDFEELEMIGFENINLGLEMDTLTVDLDEFYGTPKDIRSFLIDLAANGFVFDDFADPTFGGVFPDLSPVDWNHIIVAEPYLNFPFVFFDGTNREGRISWERSDPDFDAEFVRYELYRSTTPTVNRSSLLMTATTNPDITEFVDLTIDDVTPMYYYRVYAYYDFGTAGTAATYGNKRKMYNYIGP